MKEFLDEKEAAWAAHRAEFDCDHAAGVLITKRTIRGGGVQYVRQCVRCGEPTSNPIAGAAARAACGGREPPPFNQAALESWEDRRKLSSDAILRKFDRSAFMVPYDEYLNSEAWKARRRLVIDRAGNLCEGCRSAAVDEVHHLTYKHAGNEFLFVELVALCHPCHERLHAEDE